MKRYLIGKPSQFILSRMKTRGPNKYINKNKYITYYPLMPEIRAALPLLGGRLIVMRGMEKESIWKGVVEMAMTEKSKVDIYIIQVCTIQYVDYKALARIQYYYFRVDYKWRILVMECIYVLYNTCTCTSTTYSTAQYTMSLHTLSLTLRNWHFPFLFVFPSYF